MARESFTQMMRKYRTRTTFLAIVALCLLLSRAAQASDLQDHLLSGSKFSQEKKYKEAIREYEIAVKLDPKSAEANQLLGLTLTVDGDLDRALQYTAEAVKLNPSYSTYYNLGLIYARQEKYPQAESAYESALGLNPKSYQAWHQLGKVYATDLKFDKAIEAYGKVIELNPHFPEAYQGLGSSYYWNGNLESSLAQVQKLQDLQLNGRADELDGWIKDKEVKKKRSAEKRPPAPSR